MKRATLGSLVCFLLLATSASAGLIVRAGNHELAPNQANQIVSILIEGSEPGNTLQAMNLNIQVGNGASGPKITAVDVIGPGTVFASNNNGQGGGKITDYTWVGVGTIASVPLTVTGTNNMLAKVTIDTSGLFAGSGPWDFKLLDTLNGDSSLLGTEGQDLIVNGSLSIVPEPASVLTFLAVGGVLLPGVYSRCRRKRVSG